MKYIQVPGKGNNTKFIEALDSICGNGDKVPTRITNKQDL